MREVINHLTHTHLLNTIKSILTQTLKKTLQEESLWQVDFDNLYFWNILNKTYQGIFMWNRDNRLHTSNKKHVHKERKETTHVRVGEKDIHHHKYIKNKHNVCKQGHKTDVYKEGGKHFP